VEESDAVADSLGLLHPVGGEEKGPPPLLPEGEGFENAGSLKRIHTRRGFVKEEEAGAVEEASGKIEASLHPSRQTIHPLVLAILQSRKGETVLHSLGKVFAHQVGAGAENLQVFSDSQILLEGDLLRDIPKDPSPLPERLPLDEDASLLERESPHHRLHQSGLS